MCNPVSIQRPEAVLAKGVERGFQWEVVHNLSGYRCGYVRVPKTHPWYGKGYDDVGAEVHGGLSFAEADVACGKGGADDGWWVGFDCAHAGDARDYSLPFGTEAEKECLRMFDGMHPIPSDTIKDTDYVIAECKSLCAQAAEQERDR